MSALRALSLILTVVALGISCGGEGTGPGQTPVASVTVAPVLNTIAPAATVQLTATPKDSAGNPLSGRTVTWASANQAVATVSTTGLVTGVADGAATMTATSEGKSGTGTVTVRFMFASITAGLAHSCGLTEDGVAYCWGANPDGELGDGSRTSSIAPVLVSGGLRFTSLSAGDYHTCGVATGGAAYCWGGGAIVMALTPTVVSGGHLFASLSAGAAHTCGVTTSGEAYCWGDNSFGQLGNDSVAGASNDPRLVVGGRSFASVTAGDLHTCGVANSAAGYCWGIGDDGEIGNGLRYFQNFAPVAVAGGHAFASVSAGRFFTCGVSTDSMAYCWGANPSGQLGNGSTVDTALPVAVDIAAKIASLEASTRVMNGDKRGFACAVTSTGAAYCWGANPDGQLGNGSTDSTPLPVSVSGGLTFLSVSPGGTHTCGVTKSGDAYCWGDNSSGQLGDGTTISRTTPVHVLEPSGSQLRQSLMPATTRYRPRRRSISGSSARQAR